MFDLKPTTFALVVAIPLACSHVRTDHADLDHDSLLPGAGGTGATSTGGTSP